MTAKNIKTKRGEGYERGGYMLYFRWVSSRSMARSAMLRELVLGGADVSQGSCLHGGYADDFLARQTHLL